MKRAEIVYALPERQWTWEVSLPDGATVADALASLRATLPADAQPPDLDWDRADVGIHGLACALHHVYAAGDRIEIYRPLAGDPRVRRRERVNRSRAAARRR